MKTILLSALALGAMTSAVLADSSAPMRLTDAQMDSVTAGGVAVGVMATATASGSPTLTLTSTLTQALGLQGVDAGLGSGAAFAHGVTSHDAQANIFLAADGEVLVDRTVTVDLDGIRRSTAHIAGVIVSVPQ